MAYQFNPIEGIFDLVGGVEKEWTAFTPSLEATGTNPNFATTHKKKASYKIVGKSLHIIWSYSHIFDTGATPGSGDYLIPIPAGYTIDTSKVNLASVENGFAYGTPVGNGLIMQDFNVGQGSVVVYNTTFLKFITTKSGSSAFTFIKVGNFNLDVNNYKLIFTAEIPIL